MVKIGIAPVFLVQASSNGALCTLYMDKRWECEKSVARFRRPCVRDGRRRSRTA